MTGAREAYLPSPWFRLDYVEFDRLTAGLKANEIGILMKLLVHFHKHGEPTPNDAARLARMCGTSKPAFNRAIELFLTSGIFVQYGGKIWSRYIEDEIAHRRKISVQARKNSSVKRAKIEKNQSGDLAGDDKSYRDIEGETPRGSPLSSNMSNLTNITKSDEIAPSHASNDASGARQRFSSGQRLTIKGVGRCVIMDVGIKRDTQATFIRVRLDRDASLALVPVNSEGVLVQGLLRMEADLPEKTMRQFEWEKHDAA